MRKAVAARKSTWFQHGSTPWNKGLKKPNGDDQQTSTTSTTSMQTATTTMQQEPGPSHHSGPPMDLRQKKKTPDGRCDENNNNVNAGMRLVDSERMVELFNEAHFGHQHQADRCEQLHLTIAEEKKMGICWQFNLKCINCQYSTGLKKMYKEAASPNRGPKPAAPNVALAVGLQDTPMGNRRCRTLLANIDVPPPTRSSMQKRANMVGKGITQLNDSDMASKVEMLKAQNLQKGQPQAEINIAMDGRYNSATIASRKKPGQNASQLIATACETMTEEQFIIAAVVQNKLCWTGAWLRGRGFNVQCPGGHAECTANRNRHVPLSEFEAGKTIGQELGLQGTFIKYATTDGDARSAAGVQEAMTLLNPMWRVQRQADPVHLGQAQFRHCYNAVFSSGMFPTARTREKRQELQKALSNDIKARCSLIVKELLKESAGDLAKIKLKLPDVVRSTVRCYSGDCSDCRRHAIVCGGYDAGSWWNRSYYLATHGITNLNMNENDTELLQEIIKIKLSATSMEEMKLGTSTQKCEAVNRAMSVSLPKNVNYSRNVYGRVASTVHRLNNKVANSTVSKLRHFGVSVSPKTKRSLDAMQKQDTYNKAYVKSKAGVKRQTIRRGQQIRDHIQSKKSSAVKGDYRKGQLDPVPSTSKGGNCDHTYSQD